MGNAIINMNETDYCRKLSLKKDACHISAKHKLLGSFYWGGNVYFQYEKMGK